MPMQSDCEATRVRDVTMRAAWRPRGGRGAGARAWLRAARAGVRVPLRRRAIGGFGTRLILRRDTCHRSGNHLLRRSMGASASTGIAAALKASSSDELVKVVGGLDEATKKKLLEALDGPKNKG